MNDADAMKCPTPDALDLDVVDALQVNPRAPWKSIAELVDRSEVSVSRRYARLQKHGLAWTGIALHPLVCHGAYIEIRCWTPYRDELIRNLSQRPDVVTIGALTGDFNIYCIIIGVSLVGVIRRIDTEFEELRFCEQMRVHFFHRISGGVDWRQGLLNMDMFPEYLNAVAARQRVRQRSERAITLPPALKHRHLFLALSNDARAPLVRTADALDTSPTSIKKTIDLLMQRSQIIFRCDVARRYFDYPIGIVLTLRVHPAEQVVLAQTIGSWRETRFCASVASTANLVVIAGLRDLVDGERLVTEIFKLSAGIEIFTRSISTKMFKLYGRILGSDGRAVGHVPVDPWMGVLD